MAKLTVTNAKGISTTYDTSKIEERDNTLILTGRKIEISDGTVLAVEGNLELLSLRNAAIEVEGDIQIASTTNGDVLAHTITNVESRNGDIYTTCMKGTFDSMHGEAKGLQRMPIQSSMIHKFLFGETSPNTQVTENTQPQNAPKSWLSSLVDKFNFAEEKVLYHNDHEEGVLSIRVQGNVHTVDVENGNIAASKNIAQALTINGEVHATNAIDGRVKTISADLYAQQTLTVSNDTLTP